MFINSFFFSENERIVDDIYHINKISIKDKKHIVNSLSEDTQKLTRVFKDCFELNEIFMKKVHIHLN